MKNKQEEGHRETPPPERTGGGSRPFSPLARGEWLAALRGVTSGGSGNGWRRLFLTVAGVVFLVSGGTYVRNKIRYSGVTAWPSVEAVILGQTGMLNSVTTMGRQGLTTITVDTTEAQFEYHVNGRTFPGTRGSPDHAGLPSNPWGKPWRAFYHPASPETAVLQPSPYEGAMPLFTAFISGIFVAVPLYCAFRDRVSLRRKSRPESGLSAG